MTKKFRVFATCDIGEAIELLRARGYEVEVYPQPEAPPKSLILEKVKSGDRRADHHAARSRLMPRCLKRAKAH